MWQFSNFQPATIVDEMGITYPTVEHYYQAQKTYDRERRLRISVCETPAQAKKLGRSFPASPDWAERKERVMLAGLKQKFTLDTEHGRGLLHCDDPEITEFNTWCDTYWGRCICDTHKGMGSNRLGVLLMRIRDTLFNDYYWWE